jgi:nitrate/TMAO reductase-like tetraheme cytochrome c subunit
MADNKPAPIPLKRSIWRNWISLAGTVIAIGSFFAFLLLFAFDLFAGEHSNPYVGILSYVVAPGFLLLGLGLLFFGAWLSRRQQKRQPDAPAPQLSIDLENPRDRKRLLWFTLGTMTFLLFTALGSFQTYQITETVDFCGKVCHEPMKPEFTAYQNGTHAHVTCVECHVGSGAAFYLKSKINGAHQLWGVISGNYKHPIPTPVSNLRPAQDTCEKCHWPQRFSGNLERTYNHTLVGEDGKTFTVRLLLHVGGGDSQHGLVGGIHWHTSKEHRVEYYAEDEQRLKIPWVRVSNSDGTSTVYKSPEFKGEPDPAKLRTMDCLDCHNRPAHRYKSPNEAVDQALYLGKIDAKLPAAKRTIVDLLTKAYATEAEATAAIDSGLRSQYGNQPATTQAIATVTTIYKENFFPFMKADWSKYPEHIGHKDWLGCFRCHDNQHEAIGKPGKKMAASDCNTCHTILAQGSGAELTKLAPEGLEFKHPDAMPEGLTCSDCHNGKNQSP